MGEGKWQVKKHDADYHRQWRKLHQGIGAKMLEIQAMDVTMSFAVIRPNLSFLPIWGLAKMARSRFHNSNNPASALSSAELKVRSASLRLYRGELALDDMKLRIWKTGTITFSC